MKASYQKKHSRFFVIGLAASVLCSLLAFSAHQSGSAGFLSGALGTAVTPLQKLGTGIYGLFEEKMAYFQGIDALRAENESLKKEITSLERKISELEPTQKENEMLYNFLELKRERTNIKMVNATVIGRAASNYTSEFTIDKGSIHGLAKDMPVMAEDNTLLGVLTEVGPTYARGKALTSYDVTIGVKNERTGEPALVSGSLSLDRKGLCEAADLLESSDVKVGDIMRTSGLGDTYPPGLYVGSVTELVPNALDHTVSAVVKPSSNVYDTDLVMVITDFDRTQTAETMPSGQAENAGNPENSEAADPAAGA